MLCTETRLLFYAYIKSPRASRSFPHHPRFPFGPEVLISWGSNAALSGAPPRRVRSDALLGAPSWPRPPKLSFLEPLQADCAQTGACLSSASRFPLRRRPADRVCERPPDLSRDEQCRRLVSTQSPPLVWGRASRGSNPILVVFSPAFELQSSRPHHCHHRTRLFSWLGRMIKAF